MKMFAKTVRSAFAFVLVAALMLGVCSSPIALAADALNKEGPVNYVSLGDSMTNGYGLDGYNGNTGVEDYGEKSYANEFAAWLGADTNHAQLAMSAMRAEDLHWLLEVDYNDPAVENVINEMDATGWNEELWYSVFTNGDYWTWNELVDNYRLDVAAYCIEGKDGGGDTGFNVNTAYAEYDDIDSLKIVAKYYQDSVKNADVISLAIGNGNFGVFAFGRIMEAIGFDGEPADAMIYNIENALRECDEATKAEILKLMDDAEEALAEYGIVADDGDDSTFSTMEALYNTAMYAVVSYALNYAGAVEAILSLNPDAEIIQVALMNTMESKDVVADDVTLGQLMGYLFTSLNAYLAALPTAMQAAQNSVYADATFYWAEAPYVEVIADTYATDFNDTVRQRFYWSIVEDEYGDPAMIWGLLDGKVVEITLDEIVDYEALSDAGKVAYAAANGDKAMSIAMYLAFENAIIAGKNTPVSINTVMGLGTLLDGDPFGPIMTKFASEAAIKNDANLDAVAAFIAGQSGGLLSADNVVALALAADEDLNDVIYGIAAVQASALATSLLGSSVTLTAEQVKALTNDTTKDAAIYELVAGLSGGVLNAAAVETLVGVGAYAFVASQMGRSETEVETIYNNDGAPYHDEVVAKVDTLNNILYKITLIEGKIPEIEAGITAMEAIPATASALYTLLVMPEVLGDVVADSSLAGLLGLFARCIIGNGVGSHPSAEGHNAIYEAVKYAYENDKTSTDKTIENVVYLVTEYYDDAYAFGYEYALENGYVDAVVDALDAAIAAVEAAELDTLGLTAELKAEVAAELAEVVEALEAAKALVVEADVLDEATLNALVAALEEANDALAQVNAVLAQAGADVNNLVILPAIEAAQEYVETVVIPAVEKAVDEAIEAAKEAAKIAAEKAYEYLVEALGDAYDYLVEAIVDAVVTYMPVVDEMLYDYFYNNPEEVIEFVKTYGPYLVPVVEEYGDEALALVGYVLYTYGEDMAAYVIENSDEILAGFEAWADKYGERTAEMLQVYAETLGLCDAVREQIAELEAALEELKAELDKVTGEAKAAIEAEIAKIEAAIEELNAKVDAVIDALNNAVADANAKVEDVIADIEAAIEDLKASVEELEAAVESLVNETLAAIREEIFAANRAVLEEVKALAEDILNKQIENLEDLVEALEEAAVAAAKEIKAIIDELVYEATHGEYVIENDSFYVALGDSSAVSESYVDALAAVLGVDYANLAKAGDTTTETLALIAEQAEVLAKADLVTVGYTANIFTAEVTYTMQNILMGDPVEVYDWVALVGENGAEYVEKALAEVRAKLVEEGLDIEVSGRNVADMLMACVEAYAYTYVAHVLTYPEIVNAIHEVAPEALVVIVGLHNTVENIVIDIEGTEIALGDYVQYAVDAANVISLVNAILVEDTVFVATPDVETLKEEKGDELTYDMISFVFEAILTNGADFATSKAGHAYITEQILNALTIIDNRTGLLGDADSDGDVDNVDAMLVLQYDAALIGENDLDLTVCDVNGDGLVDNVDAMLILQYDALLIEVFPVEE